MTTKDTKTLVYRTVFGKAHLPTSRFYACCSQCGTVASGAKTFSPLALTLPERTHPQWSWLQSRYASVMSHRLAQIFLRDAFGAGNALPASSIKVHVRAVGDRLEREAQSTVAKLIGGVADLPKRVEPRRAVIALQIDAGYVRAAPRADGARWMTAVASKLVVPKAKYSPANAYVTGYNPHQGMRQQAFLSSVGIDPCTPVTVLSDGGQDIAHACQLPSAAERVLGWFHIGMRFEHLLIAVRGLRGLPGETKDALVRRISRLRLDRYLIVTPGEQDSGKFGKSAIELKCIPPDHHQRGVPAGDAARSGLNGSSGSRRAQGDCERRGAEVSVAQLADRRMSGAGVLPVLCGRRHLALAGSGAPDSRHKVSRKDARSLPLQAPGAAAAVLQPSNAP